MSARNHLKRRVMMDLLQIKGSAGSGGGAKRGSCRPSSRSQPWTRGAAILAACVGLISACHVEDRPATEPDSIEGLTRLAHETPPCGEVEGVPGIVVQVDTLVSGLEVPWDMVFLPDDRMLITERPGRIRLVQDGELLPEPWAVLDVAHVAEAGLLGIDVQADFRESEHVYVMKTYQDIPSGRFQRLWAALMRRLSPGPADEVTTWRNRVVRFTDSGDRGVAPTIIIDDIPAGPIHAGGALRFGPDGLLHLGIGDGAEPPTASDPASLRGKVLRLDSSGRPSGVGNARNSPVFAQGLRNPQGISWDPLSGDLFAIDHGPTGLEREDYRRDKDELNRIIPGGDYGWPTVAGMWSGGGFETPVAEWTPAIAPAGMTFVDASGHPWHGDLFVTGLVGQQVRRVVLDRDPPGSERVAVQCEEVLFHHELGRLRAIRAAPDGSVYFGTSNRDQRGRPGSGEDFILRMSPRPASN